MTAGLSQKRPAFCLNRLFDAAFYAVSALMTIKLVTLLDDHQRVSSWVSKPEQWRYRPSHP